MKMLMHGLRSILVMIDKHHEMACRGRVAAEFYR